MKLFRYLKPQDKRHPTLGVPVDMLNRLNRPVKLSSSINPPKTHKNIRKSAKAHQKHQKHTKTIQKKKRWKQPDLLLVGRSSVVLAIRREVAPDDAPHSAVGAAGDAQVSYAAHHVRLRAKVEGGDRGG